MSEKKELSAKYNPAEVEDKWYSWWLEHRCFHSEPNDKEPYTIVIPPPNVTGILHMGHVLNNTLNDVLIRKARMDGKNACWVPGTDHASIATESKVVARLKEKGISKEDLTREEFLKYAWEWKEEHGGIILQQLKKLCFLKVPIHYISSAKNRLSLLKDPIHYTSSAKNGLSLLKTTRPRIQIRRVMTQNVIVSPGFSQNHL